MKKINLTKKNLLILLIPVLILLSFIPIARSLDLSIDIDTSNILGASDETELLADESDLLIFENDNFRYSYPAEWTLISEPLNILYVNNPETFRGEVNENLSVIYQQVPDDLPEITEEGCTDLGNESLDFLTNNNAYESIELQSAQISDLSETIPFCEMIFSGKNNQFEQPLNLIQYYYQKDTIGFTITMSFLQSTDTFEKSKEVVRTMELL